MYPSIEAENLPHFDLIFKEIVGDKKLTVVCTIRQSDSIQRRGVCFESGN